MPEVHYGRSAARSATGYATNVSAWKTMVITANTRARIGKIMGVWGG